MAEHPGPFHGFPSLGDIWEGQERANLRYLNGRLRADLEKAAKENAALRQEVERLRRYVAELEDHIECGRRTVNGLDAAAGRAVKQLTRELAGHCLDLHEVCAVFNFKPPHPDPLKDQHCDAHAEYGEIVLWDYINREKYKIGMEVETVEKALAKGKEYSAKALRTWPHCTGCGHVVSPDAAKCRDCGKERYLLAPQAAGDGQSSVEFDPGSFPIFDDGITG